MLSEARSHISSFGDQPSLSQITAANTQPLGHLTVYIPTSSAVGTVLLKVRFRVIATLQMAAPT